jgi:gluconolactonase
MKRSLLFLALGGLLLACTADSGGGTTVPAPKPPDNGKPPQTGGGGGGGSSSGGSSSGGSSSGGSSSGGSSSGGTVTNPFEGVTAIRVVNGTAFPDGLQWKNNVLMFSDPGATPTVIVAYDSAASPDPLSPFKEPANTAIGLALDNKGQLLAAETQPVGQIVRYDDKGVATVVANAAEGVAFDSPGKIAVRKSDGMMFVTDPGYQVVDQATVKNRIYRITAAGVATTLETFTTPDRPNGIALSKDDKTLYVTITEPASGSPFVRKSTVNADGSLTGTAKFISFAPGSTPDGITTDDNGNVYVAWIGGVDVYKSDGTKLGALTTPTNAINVRFGGADRKSLFIAALTGVYEAKLKVTGRVD